MTPGNHHDDRRPGPTTGPDLVLQHVQFGLSGPITDVRISAGVIAEVGNLDASGAARIDGTGGTLLPGLRDRHVHMTQWATGLQRVDLAAADSAGAAAAALASAPSTDSEVLWGKNFRDALWPDTPHKEILDRAAPGRPVALVSNDLHSVWLSSAALLMIDLDHPTGLLREESAFDAIRRLPTAAPHRVDRWVLAAADLAAGRGVTALLDFEFADTITDWRRRQALRALPVRVEAAIYRPELASVLDAGLRTGDPVPGTGGSVTVGPCKVLLDGSLNTRTAYCHRRYPGSDSVGLLTQDPAELTRTMVTAAERGVTFAVHAIGDAANHLALNCFRDSGGSGRIEHAQLVDDQDLQRFGELGVIASVQPGHAPEDRDVADTHWAGVTGQAFPYRSLLAAGAVLELGSDAPVSRLDPWHAIACAVYRTVDDRPAWHPEQSLTLEQALAASTGGRTVPAVGDVADLVLTGMDPTTAAREELAQMPVRLTLLAGRVTHRSVPTDEDQASADQAYADQAGSPTV